MVVVPLTRTRTPRSRRRAVTALVAGLALVAASAGPAAAAVMTPVRMVVGSAVTDSTGARWTKASGTVGGKVATSKAAIAGTTDDALYQRELLNPTAWNIRVGDPGTYTVQMRQAELTAGAAGKRVFDITAEGAVVVSELDIFARTGGKNRALDLSFAVEVTDGTLNLGLVTRIGQPKVSAIQVTQDETPSPPEPAPAPATAVKPGPDTTGVPAGTVLKRHDGNLTITTAGTHLDAMDIHGYVTISAPNVRITRSIIRGSSKELTGPTPLVKSYEATSTGLVIEDTEIRPAYPSYWQDGVGAQNATLRRVEITGTVDGVGVLGDNLHVVDSWIHDLTHYAWVPNQSDGSHNDGIQVHLGTGLRVTNSTITGGRNAAVMVTPSTGAVSDAQIVGNWLDHGGCTVNISEKNRGPIQGLVIADNRFGRNTSVPDCPVIMPATTAAVAVITGNVYDDTGLPARIRTNGA